MNLKGGVGKTSLTLIFRTEEQVDQINEDRTFCGILCDPVSNMERKVEHCAISVHPRIDLIPSHERLIRPMLASMIAHSNGRHALRFGQMADNFSVLIETVQAKYDLIVLDTNPSGNLATFLAVKHAEYIVAPVSSDRFSIRGIALMRELFCNEFEWLGREPWRLIPIINKVANDIEAARVRDQLKTRAQGSFGEEALIEYIRYSGFLDYDEKKMGFAADRHAWAMNAKQKSRMIENLQRAAKEY